MTESVIAAFPSSTGSSREPETVVFNRIELSQILNIYGRMVAAGEWRDYAIDMTRDAAIFSIFRRSSEMPLYRIVKAPKLARKQGAYTIYGPGYGTEGQILKRGHGLETALRVLERKLIKAVDD